MNELEIRERRRLYIGNAFSVSMLAEYDFAKLIFRKLSTEDVKKSLVRALRDGVEIISVVGHPATAEIMSKLLGFGIGLKACEGFGWMGNSKHTHSSLYCYNESSRALIINF